MSKNLGLPALWDAAPGPGSPPASDPGRAGGVMPTASLASMSMATAVPCVRGTTARCRQYRHHWPRVSRRAGSSVEKRLGQVELCPLATMSIGCFLVQQVVEMMRQFHLGGGIEKGETLPLICSKKCLESGEENFLSYVVTSLDGLSIGD